VKEVLGDAKPQLEFLPAVGNHDNFEPNQQEFGHGMENNNPYVNRMHDLWNTEHWLSDEESKIFQKYGYYSKPLRFNPKFKVIVLNTNVAYDFNYRLLVNRYDPGGQLKWFE